ncbi:MAG: M48 family metalloprotease [Limimaricola sp.]|uniref:M48 family metallopeptidase n=1 Tax=Limimaricola sp. TaxID=2211665 RepID=UPI001D9DD62C|nr:M48 family metallopeptidase [Limimaricola sp.]MBI1415851.1 M48 family metalloprotease [Limimaricola sp.]
MFLRRLLIVIVCLGLAACDVAAPKTPSAPVSSERSAAARAAVQMFLDVVDNVAPVAASDCRARAPGRDCNFVIGVDSDPRQPPNAFQTTDRNGHPVIVFTIALIASVQNPDELAFVMSHEVAHHILGHLALTQANAAAGADAMVRIAAANGRTTRAQLRAAQQLGAELGARRYSKEFELQADALGTVIAHDAGYDPVKGALFFFRLPDPGNDFMSTHPGNAERYALVQRVAAGF